MLRKMPLSTFVCLALSLILVSSCVAEVPSTYQISGVPRIKQLTNYCGPACVAAVMQFHGSKIGQEAIGREIYIPSQGSTSGADMLDYARKNGFSAYSWNTSIEDAKQKIAAGFPIIALQQNSESDPSGHYRVLVGYNDAAKTFTVMDPYYDITERTYRQTDKFWRRMGFWALLIVPPAKDSFSSELEAKNPVVHMDLSYAQFTRRDYDNALREAKLALGLEPGNQFALSLMNQIQAAMGAGKRGSK